MKYNTIAELETYFRNEIGRLSQKEMDDARNEIQRIKNRSIKQIEDYEAKNTNVYLEHEVKSIESEHAIAISKLVDENQRKLMRMRNELIEELFGELKSKLKAYTATEEYLSKMKAKIEAVSGAYGSKANLLISENDMKYAEELGACFKGEAQVKAKKEIEIGGFIIEFYEENIFIDETYDAKLKEQHNKFYANSELILN